MCILYIVYVYTVASSMMNSFIMELQHVPHIHVRCVYIYIYIVFHYNKLFYVSWLVLYNKATVYILNIYFAAV